VTALSEPRVPSGPDGRGPVKPGGAVYSSQHAIRSMIRSETDTRAIDWHPEKESDPAGNRPAKEPAKTNPELAPVSDNAVVAAKKNHVVPQARHPVPDVEPARVREKGRILLPVLMSSLVAFVVAVGYLAIREPAPAASIGRWSATTAATATPETAPPRLGMAADPLAAGVPDPFHTQTLALHGAPTRLKITAIGVDTALETLHLGKAGELDPPKDFGKAGWYADGTAPGEVGPAVLAGHVDTKRGPAVFYRLRELEEGDRIEVVRDGRTVTFTVSSTAWYPKNAFPTGQVYGPTPDSQLRLITCGGVFDHRLRSYRANLVVYAVAG
jgi:hypothetical protein